MIIEYQVDFFLTPQGCHRTGKVMSSLRDLGTVLVLSRIVSSLRDFLMSF